MRARIGRWSFGVMVATFLGACSESTAPGLRQIEVLVSPRGNGIGGVKANLPVVGINCGFDPGILRLPCKNTFPDAGGGGVFTLDATPAPGSTFGGWSGCSSAVGPVCTLSFGLNTGDTSFVVLVRFDLVNTLGVNLLQDPGFEAAVAVGGLPTVTGQWRGDSVYSVGVDQGITPTAGTKMLRFVRSGLVPGAGVVSSQVWQLVDVSALATEIDAGKIQVDASAWFNRVAGDLNTDTRFDLRVHSFSGSPASFPTDYPSPAAVGDTVYTTGNLWQQATVMDILPVGTRYLAVEIYAFEDIQDDAVDPEFDGHYADDLSLILTQLP